jgi:hypothetical protein
MRKLMLLTPIIVFTSNAFGQSYVSTTSTSPGSITIVHPGSMKIDQSLWVNNGGTISSDFADSDPNLTWNSNFSVRNNNNAINTFSRLTFVSQSGGFGAISLKKVDTYSGDMYFQVRNGPGFYNTPMLIKANGNIGIGTADPLTKLEVLGKTGTGMRQNGTSADFEALSVFNTTASNLPSGNAAVIQFYNNAANNNNGIFGASIKSVSVNNFYGWESDLYLRTTKNNSYSSQTILDALVVKGGSGNVGIGTTDPKSFKLAVEGKIWAKEVQVALTNPGPDYVFEPTYNLKPLAEIETYIKENKHLPEVPSAKEMEKNGVQLGEMNMLLLKKVEELTLYVIEQNKEMKKLRSENENMKQIISDLSDLKSQFESIKSKLK